MSSFNTSLGDKAKGYIIDLRNDPGGLLDMAISVSDSFLDRGEVVSTRGRHADETQRFNATKGDLAGGKPVVVLINGGSASASEIVAGALKDQKRALILGTKSFGKGSVQTIMPLNNDTAIKLTTARYYTPSGRSIQLKGITPDIVVEEPGDLAARLREADLQHHLDNPQDESLQSKSAPDAAQAAANAKPGLTKPVEFGSKDDFQLEQALAFLKGEPVKGEPSKTVAQGQPAK